MDHLVSQSWCHHFFWFFCDYFLTHYSGPANQKWMVKSRIMYPFLLWYVLKVCRLILREKSVHHEEEYKVKFTLDIPMSGENQLLLNLSGDNRLWTPELLCLYIQSVLYLTFTFFSFCKRSLENFHLHAVCNQPSKTVLMFLQFFLNSDIYRYRNYRTASS